MLKVGKTTSESDLNGSRMGVKKATFASGALAALVLLGGCDGWPRSGSLDDAAITVRDEAETNSECGAGSAPCEPSAAFAEFSLVDGAAVIQGRLEGAGWHSFVAEGPGAAPDGFTQLINSYTGDVDQFLITDVPDHQMVCASVVVTEWVGLRDEVVAWDVVPTVGDGAFPLTAVAGSDVGSRVGVWGEGGSGLCGREDALDAFGVPYCGFGWEAPVEGDHFGLTLAAPAFAPDETGVDAPNVVLSYTLTVSLDCSEGAAQ